MYDGMAVKAKNLTAKEAPMKQDALTLSLLFDYYGDLLTDKQKICFDLYCNQDFSLSEIAEQTGVTRQGVHDSLNRAEAVLCELEEKLGCVARFRTRQQALRRVEQAAERLRTIPGGEADAAEILCAVQQIKE